MAAIPLLGHDDRGAIFAYRGKQAVTVAEFVADVRRLARLLPERPYMLNLCGDRYRFAVGFSAALLRAQISLLPPNYTPDFVGRLSAAYPGLYCLSDGRAEFPGVAQMAFPDLPDSEEQTAVPHVPAEQCAALVFTSGSTGDPVAHAKSWGALSADGIAEAAQLGIPRNAGLAVLGTVPPQHMYGLESTVLLPMQSGQVLVAGKPFYAGDICAQLQDLPSPRCLVTTPVHLRALLGGAVDLPAVDFVMSATAPLALSLAEEAESRFAAPLYEIYGCTEAGQLASRRTAQGTAWQLFGGISLRRDADGKTWAHGGHVEIEAPLSDVIEMNDDGSFLLHGRSTDMVNIAGKRTSLESLNHHLNAVAGVRDGVFVLPDDSAREMRPMAFVVAPGVAGETILQALRERIDPVFLPRPLCFVDALPRNATGKLTREALQQLARQHARG